MKLVAGMCGLLPVHIIVFVHSFPIRIINLVLKWGSGDIFDKLDEMVDNTSISLPYNYILFQQE